MTIKIGDIIVYSERLAIVADLTETGAQIIFLSGHYDRILSGHYDRNVIPKLLPVPTSHCERSKRFQLHIHAENTSLHFTKEDEGVVVIYFDLSTGLIKQLQHYGVDYRGKGATAKMLIVAAEVVVRLQNAYDAGYLKKLMQGK